jgi:hypothetical protein
MSDETAMLNQVVVKRFCKLVKPQTALEEANPRPQDRCLLSG